MQDEFLANLARIDKISSIIFEMFTKGTFPSPISKDKYIELVDSIKKLEDGDEMEFNINNSIILPAVRVRSYVLPTKTTVFKLNIHKLRNINGSTNDQFKVYFRDKYFCGIFNTTSMFYPSIKK